MRLERYAGVYGTTINPAHTAFNPNRWDISLMSADLFFENSYAYLRRTSWPEVLRNSDKIIAVTDTSAENQPPRDPIWLDYFDARKNMRVVFQSRVAGPSFSIRLGENYTAGLVTSFRTAFSAYKIPKILSYRTISDVPVNQTINISPAGFQGMAWGEVGVHFSRLNTDRDVATAFGVVPRLLLGFEGFYTRAQSAFDYTQRQGDTVAFGSARWDYALTTGNFTDEPDSIRARIQGIGFGLDAGFAWAAPAGDGDSEADYAWRFGISLIDAGFVRFGKSAERHHIRFDTTIAVSNSDFPPADLPHELIEDASQAFLGNPAASLRARSFSIGLPTALSVQSDVKLSRYLYCGALLIQRFKIFRHSLQRPSTLAVTPRFEHRWFSFSLPLVLNDWQSFRIGMAARLAFLHIGTDNLGSFFRKNKLTGADFYIGLKINAFSFGTREGSGLRSSDGGHTGRQKRRKIKCYSF